MRSFIVMALLSTALFGQNAGVMITEIAWFGNEAVEITNFSTATVNMQNWIVQWHDGVLITSAPLGISIDPGEVVVVTDNAGYEPTYAWATDVAALPPVSTTTEDFSVALIDGNLVVIDEVQIADTSGGHSIPQLGGVFRGLAPRVPDGGGVFNRVIERIWRLDSDAGADWTAQWTRSLGAENRNSGPRGNDTYAVDAIRLNELDTSPDYIELLNYGTSNVNLQGWSFLCTSAQGGTEVRVAPFPSPTIIPAGGYLVVGDLVTPPSELPAGVPYVSTATNIPWTSTQISCALYDDLGRCIDIVRTTGPGNYTVHNHPRSPAPWDAFTGAAHLPASGPTDGSIGRHFAPLTTGESWRGFSSRTMGLTNGFATVGPNLTDALDVRLHEGGGDGLTLIVNAGPANAGMTWSFVFDVGHANGPVGGESFLGLPLDAWLNNWTAVTAPGLFSGPLDERGSARLDLGPGDIAPGLELDTIFVLQDSTTQALLALTRVLEFDT